MLRRYFTCLGGKSYNSSLGICDNIVTFVLSDIKRTVKTLFLLGFHDYRRDSVIFELSYYEKFNYFSLKINSFPVAFKKTFAFELKQCAFYT